MQDTYRSLTRAIWRHVGDVSPPAAPRPSCWFVAEPHPPYGPRHGSDAPLRLAIGRPVEASDGWVCHVDLEGFTAGPVAVPGRGPVDAVIAAMRVLAVADEAWSGFPHLAPGHVQPARRALWEPAPIEQIDDVLAEDRWRAGGRETRVALGDLVRGPDPRDPHFCHAEGFGSGPRPSIGFGAARAVRSAAQHLARRMLLHDDVARQGEPLEGPHQAVVDTFWRGVAELEAAPAGEVVADDVWPGGLVFGRPAPRRIRVGRPVASGDGWVCPVSVEGRTGGFVAAPGRGPVDSLIAAMRIVDLAHHDWFAVASRPEPHEAAEVPDGWRAPAVPRIGEVLAEDVWRVRGPGGTGTHRVTIGRPHENPNDRGGTWVCYAEIEGWYGPQPVYGVGPVDTLRNAVRLAAGFLHLFEEIERA